jgi:hypothetical protein
MHGSPQSAGVLEAAPGRRLSWRARSAPARPPAPRREASASARATSADRRRDAQRIQRPRAHLNLEFDRRRIPMRCFGDQREPRHDGGVGRKGHVVREARAGTAHEREMRTAAQPDRIRPPAGVIERLSIRRVDSRQSSKVRTSVAQAPEAVAECCVHRRHAIQRPGKHVQGRGQRLDDCTQSLPPPCAARPAVYNSRRQVLRSMPPEHTPGGRRSVSRS